MERALPEVQRRLGGFDEARLLVLLQRQAILHHHQRRVVVEGQGFRRLGRIVLQTVELAVDEDAGVALSLIHI